MGARFQLGRLVCALALACGVGSTLVPSEARAEEKRSVPDYDGRTEPTTAGDVAIWAPRLLASPLYLTSEYLLRRPLAGLTKGAEGAAEEGGPGSPWHFTPIVAIDVGFHPWFGLHVRRQRVLSDDNEVHAQAAFGGVHTLLLGLADEARLGRRMTLSVFGTVTRRDDAIFHGLGPRSSPDARIRFGFNRLETGATFLVSLGGGSVLRSAAGLRATRFSDPLALGTRDRALAFQGVSAALDSRADPTRPGTAARLELDGEHAFDTSKSSPSRFVKWGASATLSLDLTGKRRVISLSSAVRFVDGISGEPPPITELVILGGDRHLRGHLFGRLVGQSAFVTAISYEWPIWVWLDGVVTAEVGDVFGPHLWGFAPRLLRSSYTLGMRASGSGAVVELLGGVATETIADGMRVSAGRFLLAIARPL